MKSEALKPRKSYGIGEAIFAYNKPRTAESEVKDIIHTLNSLDPKEPETMSEEQQREMLKLFTIMEHKLDSIKSQMDIIKG